MSGRTNFSSKSPWWIPRFWRWFGDRRRRCFRFRKIRNRIWRIVGSCFCSSSSHRAGIGTVRGLVQIKILVLYALCNDWSVHCQVALALQLHSRRRVTRESYQRRLRRGRVWSILIISITRSPSTRYRRRWASKEKYESKSFSRVIYETLRRTINLRYRLFKRLRSPLAQSCPIRRWCCWLLYDVSGEVCPDYQFWILGVRFAKRYF